MDHISPAGCIITRSQWTIEKFITRSQSTKSTWLGCIKKPKWLLKLHKGNKTTTKLMQGAAPCWTTKTPIIHRNTRSKSLYLTSKKAGEPNTGCNGMAECRKMTQENPSNTFSNTSSRSSKTVSGWWRNAWTDYNIHKALNYTAGEC